MGYIRILQNHLVIAPFKQCKAQIHIVKRHRKLLREPARFPKFFLLHREAGARYRYDIALSPVPAVKIIRRVLLKLQFMHGTKAEVDDSAMLYPAAVRVIQLRTHRAGIYAFRTVIEPFRQFPFPQLRVVIYKKQHIPRSRFRPQITHPGKMKRHLPVQIPVPDSLPVLFLPLFLLPVKPVFQRAAYFLPAAIVHHDKLTIQTVRTRSVLLLYRFDTAL